MESKLIRSVALRIFKLIEWDYEGDSFSLWSHSDKQDQDFKTDCDWILNTHFDLLLEPQIEETGEVWYGSIGSRECLDLIAKYLPKLGYTPVETASYGFRWTPFKPEGELLEVLSAENKIKAEQYDERR